MALSLGLLGLAAVSILAVARIPWRGLRDSEMGLEGYKRQKDEELRSISQGEEGHEHSK